MDEPPYDKCESCGTILLELTKCWFCHEVHCEACWESHNCTNEESEDEQTQTNQTTKKETS